MRIGLLTGGGDCPGLNAVIRAIVLRITGAGGSCVGILEGWRGLVQGRTQELSAEETDGIIGLGGTILGSSRTNPFKNPEADIPPLRANYQRLGLEGLIVIGGDDTLGVALRLWREHGMPIIGVPKTIDNDLLVTDFTFGFDTAVNIVTEAIDRLRTSAESHRRVMVVETMGRHSGWIACFAGLAVGADYIMVPEFTVDLPHCIDILRRRRARGKNYGIVVVSEGVKLPSRGGALPPRYGAADFRQVPLGDAGAEVARLIEEATGFETRCVVLGHLQRGGPPSAFDRILATRMGLAAANLTLEARFGRVVSLRNHRVVSRDLDDTVTQNRTLDPTYFQEASAFFE